MFSALGTASGLVVLECSSSSTSVFSPSITSCTSLRRRKPCSARSGMCANLSPVSPTASVLKCPAWNHQGPESRWTSDGNLTQASAVSTTLAETWVASEEATALAAAEEAMALARAAVLAAKEAAQANAEDVTVSSFEFLTLRTEAELATASREPCSEAEEMLEPEVIEEPSLERFTDEEVLESETVERVPEKRKVDLAVSSMRRQQRLLKRQQRAEAKKMALSQEVTADKEINTSSLLDIGAPKLTTSRDRYCPHMARRCRMTPEQELEAINGIQENMKMNAVKASMTTQLGREPTFREWAEGLKMDVRALHDKLAHARKCRNVMVSSNLGLVIKVAQKFAMKNSGTEDLVQEGINGLLRGVEKFDTSRGFRLSTYVLWWIELSVRRASVRRSILTQVPMHLFDMHTRVMKTRAIIYEERGRMPKDSEVAKIIGTSENKVRMVSNLMRPPRSTEDRVPGCENITIGEALTDPNPESPFMEIERTLLKQQLDNVLNMLKPREKEILSLRYGLADGRERTLEELSHYFDLSRERIRQIEKRALAKINELGGKEILASFVQTFLTMSQL